MSLLNKTKINTLYLNIYIYVCVCVCVCIDESGHLKKYHKKSSKSVYLKIINNK